MVFDPEFWHICVQIDTSGPKSMCIFHKLNCRTYVARYSGDLDVEDFGGFWRLSRDAMWPWREAPNLASGQP